jgi:uncharacterized pyridoxamine 5'-phosphate oxidase family protein
MVTWAEFEAAEPEMAAIGRGLLDQFHLAYLATVRADGAPRVHPVSPFMIEGRLIVATPRQSPKVRDQIRDGRYVIHLLPGKDDAEFRVRGRAHLIEPGALRDAVLRDGPHYVKDHDCIFEYDIEEAATAYWVNVGQPGTYPVRKSWRAPR